MSEAKDILEFVRATGRELVVALDDARDRSDLWRDESIGRELVFAAFDWALAELRATNVWGEANRLPSSALWRIAGDRLAEGELLTMARTKPRGYAGDYEMLAKIVDGYRGKTQPGRLFDDYFQTREAPQAVRSRTALAASRALVHWQIEGEGPYRIVSVGSGPALDIGFMLVKIPREQRRHIRATLIDLDPAALDFASAHLSSLGCGEVLAARENLFRLASTSRGAELLGGADFAVCTGFLDYLGDADAARLLGAMWKGLSRRGELLAFNFSPRNACRDYMEWIGNWYLTYRDEGQLAAVADLAGIPSECRQFGAEETGSDLFVSAHKVF